MTTEMKYDLPLSELWEQVNRHKKLGENGWFTVPLTKTVDTKGEYYLIAENTPKLEKNIYASIFIGDTPLTSIPFGYEQEIAGKRFVMIPVANFHTADACFKVWEDSLRNGIGITSATNYILRKVI
jgi:hypothetical protein